MSGGLLLDIGANIGIYSFYFRNVFKNIEVFETILNMDYNGFFIYEGELLSIDDFVYEMHQKSILQDTKSKKYIENFIFIPRER